MSLKVSLERVLFGELDYGKNQVSIGKIFPIRRVRGALIAVKCDRPVLVRRLK